MLVDVIVDGFDGDGEKEVGEGIARHCGPAGLGTEVGGTSREPRGMEGFFEEGPKMVVGGCGSGDGPWLLEE